MKDIKCTANGGRISVYKYGTDRFKGESITVYLCLPTSREKSVARSLLLSVLKRGTEKYPSQKQINERLDELYATLVNLKNQKFDAAQLLGVSADVIYPAYTENGEDLLPDALEVIGQMIYHPSFDESTGRFSREYIESEKENYKSIILSQINEPRTYAAIRCREEMFASLNVLEKLDTMCDKIDNVTDEEIYNCYLELINEARILVFYVGSRTSEEIYELIEKTVTLGCERHGAIEEAKPKLLSNIQEPNVIIENSDISQGRLVMGLNCGVTWQDEDYYAMLLCNEILGASPISKLMMNVREAMSMCYECSSVYNSARGAIFVTTGIDSENFELAKNAIFAQIQDIQKGKISETEFLAAKKSILNVYSAVADSPNAIERFYLGRIVNGIDTDIPEFIEKINVLTIEQVVEAAKKITPHTIYFLRGEGENDE
ncbi:MAG: insulinase family protein [Clostridia bacterium]|nr:insulinase family protein [Clostridia bacterium]